MPTRTGDPYRPDFATARSGLPGETIENLNPLKIPATAIQACLNGDSSGSGTLHFQPENG